MACTSAALLKSFATGCCALMTATTPTRVTIQAIRTVVLLCVELRYPNRTRSETDYMTSETWHTSSERRKSPSWRASETHRCRCDSRKPHSEAGMTHRPPSARIRTRFLIGLGDPFLQ